MRSSSLLAALCLLACCGSLALGASNTQHETDVRTPSATPRTLVLLDSNERMQTHSAFFSMLRARGHALEFALAGEPAGTAGVASKLAAYGATLFDNVVVLAPAAEDLGEVASLDSITKFVDMGRSVLLVGGVSVGEPLRELVAEILGIDVDEEGTRVQDHAAFVAGASNGGDDQHDLVLGGLTNYAPNFVGGRSALNLTQPILFRGLGHVAQPSALVTPVLAGSPTALSYALGATLVDYPAAAGRDVIMVSALQTRSNARVVYAGSIDMFSNELMYQPLSGNGKGAKSGNEEFVRELSAWTFQERGLLRASQLKHWKVGAEHDVNPTSYRVQDNIVFSLVLEEYNGATDSWQPFLANDLQLEFTMLDPYLRRALPGVVATPGLYSTAFQVPDVYGVYKFVVNYPRAGFSNLEVAAQVSVHPFRHDEFERFILVASPYYTAAFTIMAAFFGFGIVFLYQKE